MSPTKSLSELDLHDEAMPELLYETLPDFGAFAPPPSPGPYRFQLPDLTASIYEEFETRQGKHRLRLIFDRNHPLTLVRVPQGSSVIVGDTFQTRLSTEERLRGSVEASDVDFLLKALGQAKRVPATQLKALLPQYSGKEFGADIVYTWNCNSQRPIYKLDENGTSTKHEDQMGCGRKYYQATRTKKKDQAVPAQANGQFPYEIICGCGAVLRAFANLDNIRD